ncbi:Protein of unknown function [Pyronema omphalodes CBS 100304]|uniref:Uncharacterized protein n=1 Tax=Pyronema omphalodes (strain CBS 100304) TaxID=1076935 RepID=U4LNC2_PYROM|nr:Protein of unknown function [Pyronema omphalodes CBS 100304]
MVIFARLRPESPKIIIPYSALMSYLAMETTILHEPHVVVEPCSSRPNPSVLGMGIKAATSSGISNS